MAIRAELYEQDQLLERFKLAAEKISSLYEHITPTKTNYSHFQKLKQKKQIETIEFLELMYKTYEDAKAALAEKDSQPTTKQHFWQILKTKKWHLPSDALALLDDDDHFEILSPDHKFLWFSHSGLAITSYSVDQVFCQPYWHLFRRDIWSTCRLIQISLQIITGRVKKPIVTTKSVPEHKVEEINGTGAWTYQLKLASPLFDSDGKICAYFTGVRLKPIEKSTGSRV